MFDITTTKDFYAMLVQDYEEYVAEQGSSRKAIHAAIAALHLRDWVWAQYKKDEAFKQRLGLAKHDLAHFETWIDAQCPWFRTVQAIANGSKHFHMSDGNQFDTRRVNIWGQGPHGAAPYGHSYLQIDFGEEAGQHRLQTALALLEVVVRFWRDFLYHNLTLSDISVSEHHAQPLIRRTQPE